MFTTGDARRFLTKLGADEFYIRLMLHYLVESGSLYSIGKDAYTFHRNEAAIGFKFRPFDYGLQYALIIRKIWTQQSVPAIVTTGKANPGAREIMDTRVILHRIDRAKFFGFEYVNYGEVFVPVSDLEKTLLDFNYYHIKLSNETRESIRKKIDKVKFLEYEKRMIKSS
ncbi:type IV toxin-antitoxin system AbiEi family antitoxin domain-containing protein [Ferroplasma acidarmanus]|uniref:Transcriptional regulator n=1 Tax=Ferroplasma acidarmanus Fer1 TaxID=333146 RepID=S0ARM9_FERAC|nr:transcriptional regulator [Ferroplasma acidarmanus]AGO61853.1 transcriptional regulator [Ferroplasma acidarmanus Fer1]